jgi:hypothetical protein
VECARRQIEIYKKTLRPLIREGNLYHVSPRPTENGWDAFEYYDPQRGAGALLVFRANSRSAQEVFRLDGLEPDAAYTLRFVDHDVPPITRAGRPLMRDGLSIRLPSRESSQIVDLKRQ